MNARTGALLLFLLALASGPIVAAEPAFSVTDRSSVATDLLGEYILGPGDVLDLSVEPARGISGIVTVQPGGEIALRDHGTVRVTGLSPSAAAVVVREHLRKRGVAGSVQIGVREARSRVVTVAGEVGNPGRQPVTGRLRLIDALLFAGGLTPDAAPRVTVLRRVGTFPDGSRTLEIDLPRPGGADVPAALGTELHPGDLVTVARKDFVLVGGEVQRPGRYALPAGATLTDMIAAAGGLTAQAGRHVVVERSGVAAPLAVDLVMTRREPYPLQADDRVTIEARRLF